MVKLSVVIPHLNYGRYLKECLTSLDAQTFRDYEAILVDGGSSDNTFEVLRDFPWVKVLEDVPPTGPVRAANKGIDAMRGEYFTQLNSDCILEPTMYEECLGILEADRSLGMVYTSWYVIDDYGKTLGSARQPARFNRDLLLQGNFIDATSMVIRRECFDLVGVFDERCPWSMDWIMAVKIASSFPVEFLNRPLFYYRVHSGQITASPKMVADTARALGIIRKYYGRDALLKADVTVKAKKLARRLLR